MLVIWRRLAAQHYWNPFQANNSTIAYIFLLLFSAAMSTYSSDSSRTPQLSETLLRQALDELDAKIKTLHNRAHATVAGSPNTYEAHATALEAKRTQLAEQLAQAPAPATGPAPSVWSQIQRGIETLRHDVRELL